MKIAVLYTGEFRTIKKTLHLFKKNILDSNSGDYYVFATIQPNKDMTDISEINQYVVEVKKTMMNSLKTLEIFNKDDIYWINLKNQLLENIRNKGVPESWVQYLNNSGSMVEYYQMYKSYINMCQYEKQNGICFDLVVRFRTDTIWTKPFDLSWYTGIPNSHDEVENMYKECLRCMTKNTKNTINQSFVFPNSIKFIITFRENVIYLCPREYFDEISILGLTYGHYKDDENNYYWFNAESQFRGILKENKISCYDYMSDQESKAMGDMQYNSEILDENCENTKENLLFAIIR